MTNAQGDAHQAETGQVDGTAPARDDPQSEAFLAEQKAARAEARAVARRNLVMTRERLHETANDWTRYIGNSQANIEKRRLAIYVMTIGVNTLDSIGRSVREDEFRRIANTAVDWPGILSQLTPANIDVEAFFDRLIELSMAIRSVLVALAEAPFSDEQYRVTLREMDLLLSDLQIARLNQVGSKAQSVLADTEAAAGKVGANSIALAFDDFAKAQLVWSLALWTLMTGLTGLVIAAGAWVVLSPTFKALTIGEMLGRATLTLPVLALATYFGRQASLFADARRRAHEASVRLKTISAYTAEMSTEQRASVFELFSRTLYGRIDWSRPGEDGPRTSDLLKAVAEVVPGASGKS